MNRKRWAAAVLFVLCLTGCMICLTACGQADISSYAEQEITIAGLGEEEFTVTPAQILEMECVKRTDTGATEKAGTVKAYGPLLSTFLETYGYSIDQVNRVRFLCKDDYKVVLKKNYLTDYEIVMTATNGSKALPEKLQPLRILVPEAESSKWAYGITRIEFVLE